MEIKTLEIAGFCSALRALRLPFGLPPRSMLDSGFYNCDFDGEVYRCTSGDDIEIDPKDLSLFQSLIKRGDEHAKVVRGIIVYAEITAPVYFFAELETYRAGHERLCSESTMHIDCKGLKGEELQRAKAEISMGKELTKIDFFSYQCLRNMYKQRRNHRLPEWSDIFCSWVESLPLANELILVGLNDKNE